MLARELVDHLREQSVHARRSARSHENRAGAFRSLDSQKHVAGKRLEQLVVLDGLRQKRRLKNAVDKREIPRIVLVRMQTAYIDQKTVARLYPALPSVVNVSGFTRYDVDQLDEIVSVRRRMPFEIADEDFFVRQNEVFLFKHVVHGHIYFVVVKFKCVHCFRLFRSCFYRQEPDCRRNARGSSVFPSRFATSLRLRRRSACRRR